MVMHGVESAVGHGRGALSEYWCPKCGYGARAQTAPERCPMCSSTVWNHVARERQSWAVETLAETAPLTRDTE